MAETKSDRRRAAEIGATAGAAVATGVVGYKGVITKRKEFSALLQEKAPVATLESHKHLQRAERKMRSLPETHKRPGFGTDAYFENRQFISETGKKARGVSKMLAELERAAPVLGYTDAGMKAPDKSPLRAERKATIVIGPPAAGKSTVSNEIARANGAALIDNDVVKSKLPEFKKGIGANAVHEESSVIGKKWLERHTARGDNIVYPRTGDNPTKLAETIKEFKGRGYKVDVVHVDVPPSVSMTRMLRRFDRSGRLINPDFVRSIGDKPGKSLAEVKQLGIVETAKVVDLSADKPPKAKPAPSTLVGKVQAAIAEPRAMQKATRLGGRAASAALALSTVVQVAQAVTEKRNTNPSNEAKSKPDTKTSGTTYQRTYTSGPKAGTTETVRKPN